MKKSLLLLAALFMSQSAMASKLTLECYNAKEKEIKRDKKNKTEELVEIDKLKDKRGAIHGVKLDSNNDLVLGTYDKKTLEVNALEFDGSGFEYDKEGSLPGLKDKGTSFHGFAEEVKPELSRGAIKLFVKDLNTLDNFDSGEKLFEGSVTYYPPSARADGRERKEADVVCVGKKVDD